MEVGELGGVDSAGEQRQSTHRVNGPTCTEQEEYGKNPTDDKREGNSDGCASYAAEQRLFALVYLVVLAGELQSVEDETRNPVRCLGGAFSDDEHLCHPIDAERHDDDDGGWAKSGG